MPKLYSRRANDTSQIPAICFLGEEKEDGSKGWTLPLSVQKEFPRMQWSENMGSYSDK